MQSGAVSPLSPSPLHKRLTLRFLQPIPVDVTARGQPSFDTIAKATGCFGSPTPIACLRAVPFKRLVDATDNIGSILSYRSVALASLPRVDGNFISGNPLDLVAAGQSVSFLLCSFSHFFDSSLDKGC